MIFVFTVSKFFCTGTMFLFILEIFYTSPTHAFDAMYVLWATRIYTKKVCAADITGPGKYGRGPAAAVAEERLLYAVCHVMYSSPNKL